MPRQAKPGKLQSTILVKLKYHADLVHMMHASVLHLLGSCGVYDQVDVIWENLMNLWSVDRPWLKTLIGKEWSSCSGNSC